MNENNTKELNKEELDFKIEIATQTLERNISFVNNCDVKTSIILAIIGIFLTIIITSDGLQTIMNILSKCIEAVSFINIVYLLAFSIACFKILLGMFYLYKVLVARIREDAQGKSTENSHIFFSGIMKHDNCKVFRELFISLERNQLLKELTDQIYINAKIATLKYKNYNFGLKEVMSGFSILVASIAVGYYIYK